MNSLHVPDSEDATSPPTSPSSPDSLVDLRVLVVDDKKFSRDVAHRALTAMGIATVSQASGGKEAIEKITKADPAFDVIICDLIMPDMDGIQVVREVARLDNPPSFIFASGADARTLNATQEVAKTRGLTVLGAIEKPVGLPNLKPLLEQFEASHTETNTYTQDTLTPKEIEDGLKSGAVTLFYQPKLDVKTRAVVGVEALVRWRSHNGKIIGPGAFVEVAEDCGLIRALTDKVIDLALGQTVAWRKQNIDLKMSINVSAKDMIDVTFPDQVATLIDIKALPADSIMIEVTESGVFEDLANSLDILTRLHMKGIALSIDDFGTGYSSMEQLERIPFSELKIDRAFVTDARNRPKALAILKASIDLAQRLSLTTIAEGAETEDDLNLLEELGVDLVQGFYIARPMPPDDLETWLESWTRDHAQPTLL